LAPPGEYDRTIRVGRRCVLISNYFDRFWFNVVNVVDFYQLFSSCLNTSSLFIFSNRCVRLSRVWCVYTSFFLSTSCQSPRFLLICSYHWHFLCHRLTTLIICHFLTLLFHAQSLSFPQIRRNIAFFFFFRTDCTDSLVCLPILLSTSIFIFSFFPTVLVLGSVR